MMKLRMEQFSKLLIILCVSVFVCFGCGKGTNDEKNADDKYTGEKAKSASGAKSTTHFYESKNKPKNNKGMTLDKNAKPGTLKIGDKIRHFKAKTLDGNIINTEDLTDQYILLDFWATWCRPCMVEMPYVAKAADISKTSKAITIIGISLDKDKASVLNFAKKNELIYPIIADGKYWQTEVAKLYNVKSIPFAVLFNPEGKVIELNLRGEKLFEKVAAIVDGKKL